MNILDLSQTIFYFSASLAIVFIIIFSIISIYLKINFYRKLNLAVEAVKKTFENFSSLFSFFKIFKGKKEDGFWRNFFKK